MIIFNVRIAVSTKRKRSFESC